jgi:hypothetical protein
MVSRERFPPILPPIFPPLAPCFRKNAMWAASRFHDMYALALTFAMPVAPNEDHASGGDYREPIRGEDSWMS